MNYHKNIKYFSLYSLILILFVSCKKEIVEETDITGSWEWIVSYGGWGGTYTPESTGLNIELVFTPDLVYKEYRNDSLFLECKFQLKNPEAGYTSMVIEYDSIYYSHSFNIRSNDTLTLYDNTITDGFTNIYHRIN